MRYPTCNCFDKHGNFFEADIEITFRNRDKNGMPDPFNVRTFFNYCPKCGKKTVLVCRDEDDEWYSEY